ncbi:Putative protein of unknown function [Podospora comata]|uniref:Uncharacterized protein n=1 Tax=Podospora comata TaxID=48703 RepID=A0ABY6RTF5_PODCO|nr:Putative protein of unknown function [Podospora comata]
MAGELGRGHRALNLCETPPSGSSRFPRQRQRGRMR